MRRRFLDKAHGLNSAIVARKASPHVVEQPSIDFIDDLKLSRQKHLEPRYGPLLQRFGQQGVVGVRQHALRNVPSAVPVQSSLIEKNSHELRNGDRRVRVVELDGHLFWKNFPIRILISKSANQVG